MAFNSCVDTQNEGTKQAEMLSAFLASDQHSCLSEIIYLSQIFFFPHHCFPRHLKINCLKIKLPIKTIFQS